MNNMQFIGHVALLFVLPIPIWYSAYTCNGLPPTRPQVICINASLFFSQPLEKSNLNKDCKSSHSRKIFGKRHLQDYLMYFQTGISRKIQQLPCKKMHLSVKWQSFCVDPNKLLVSSDWIWDKIDAMFQTALWKKIQKLYKRKSVCQ